MKKIKIKPGIYSVDILDLEKLGWEFPEDDVESAMILSSEKAKEYINNTYHVEIYIHENDETTWRYVNTLKKLNGIDEGSDSESTGDDEKTKLDLIQLINEDKIWKIIYF